MKVYKCSLYLGGIFSVKLWWIMKKYKKMWLHLIQELPAIFLKFRYYLHAKLIVHEPFEPFDTSLGQLLRVLLGDVCLIFVVCLVSITFDCTVETLFWFFTCLIITTKICRQCRVYEWKNKNICWMTVMVVNDRQVL